MRQTAMFESVDSTYDNMVNGVRMNEGYLLEEKLADTGKRQIIQMLKKNIWMSKHAVKGSGGHGKAVSRGGNDE